MGSTQSWTVGLLVYFVIMTVMVILFSASVAKDETIVFSGVSDVKNFDTNLNQSELPTPSLTAVFNWGKFFKVFFGFFGFDLGFYDDNYPNAIAYLWIFKILFIYLPLMALILSIYYSLPTVSG